MTMLMQTLDYARKLLLRVEHNAGDKKSQQLKDQRTQLRRLTYRLRELEQIGDDSAAPSVVPTEPVDTTGPVEKADGELFGLRHRFDKETPNEERVAKILEENDTRAAHLTSDLLSLARALKTSSTQISVALAEDDVALRSAVDGLNKNESGLASAGRRMTMLARMSEAKGLWGRTMLYVWIAALWLVAILIVFVGPKLRF